MAAVNEVQAMEILEKLAVAYQEMSERQAAIAEQFRDLVTVVMPQFRTELREMHAKIELIEAKVSTKH
jgi:hypothetical protein